MTKLIGVRFPNRMADEIAGMVDGENYMSSPDVVRDLVREALKARKMKVIAK